MANLNIQFISDNVILTDEIKQYATRKIESLLKLVEKESNDIFAEVILEQDKPNEQSHSSKYNAHITIQAGQLKKHAIGHGINLNSAIDEAKDELERRIRREKKKRLTLFKKGARKIKEMLFRKSD